jgi:hypothetical protein
VLDTQPSPILEGSGRGIEAVCDRVVGQCGSLTVAQSVFAGNHGLGILVVGVDTSVTSTVVRDTLPQANDGMFGRGIVVQCAEYLHVCPSVTIAESLLAGNHESGLFFSGASVSVTRSVVRDTLAQLNDGRHGRGISGQCSSVLDRCGSLAVVDTLVSGNQSAGILTGGVLTSLDGVVISDTQPEETGARQGSYGQGVVALCHPDSGDCGSLELTGCLIDRNYFAGVTTLGTPGFLESSVIRTVWPRPEDDAYGYGLQVEGVPGAADTVFHVLRSQIQDAHLAGVLYSHATGAISFTWIGGAEFAVVWGGWTAPPTDGRHNVLDGLIVSGMSMQELDCSPSPEPVLPLVP